VSKNIIHNLKKIKSLESVGKPDALWLAENRRILMMQINPQNKKTEYNPYQYYYEFVLSALRQQVLRPALMAILVVGAYFGYTATIMSAKASLPGEALYPIKVLTEKVQLATTVSDESKVKLKMTFVSRRGDELQQLAKKTINEPQNKEKNTEAIASTVKKITEEVKEVQKHLDKIEKASSVSDIIDTAKVVDEKSLKVEKDIINANINLNTEVKKDVAKEVKEAIAETGAVGSQALKAIVNKNEEQKASNSEEKISEKELTSRVSERIKSSEVVVATLVAEVSKIATTSEAILAQSSNTLIVSTVSSAVNSSSTTLKEVVKDVSVAPTVAKAVIEEAKNLLENKDYVSAINKITESKVIAAEVIEKAPIIDSQIKTENASASPATSTIVK